MKIAPNYANEAKNHKKLLNMARSIVDGLQLGDLMRQAIVNAQLIGERIKFIWTGDPKTYSTIFMSGAGRSGTTWITDMLCALPGVQQIFEPLFPLWNERVREITGWDRRDPYIRSIYLRPQAEYPKWAQLWQRILTGRFRNYWTDHERNSYFPDRFLVKEIRANLMLGWLYHQFQPRIVYVLRHPCAVVHSRLTVSPPWHADVQDILEQVELVEDHLQPWASEIAQETDPLGAHAVWWAVENRVALQQLQDIPHALVFYEDLVLRPREVLESLLPWLGVERMPEKVLSLLPQPSRMSNQNLDYQDAQDRLSRWQVNLPVEEQKRVLAWAERLGVTVYDASPLPKLRSSFHEA